MPDLVSKPEDISAEWLTEVLRDAGVLPTGHITEARWKMIGTGKMANNVRFELSYADAPPTAPSRVVAKVSAEDERSRQTGAMGGAYAREVLFYRELAPTLAMRTPRCYHADVAENGADFVIIMEDMSPAAPGDQLEGCDVDTASLALAEAVKLHTKYWGDDSLADRAWLTPSNHDAAMFAGMILADMWPGFVERFGDALDPDGLELGRRFAANYMEWWQRYTGPLTLVHADYRLENMLLAGHEHPEATPISVVDWQTTSQGCGLADVAYFLGGSLSVKDRRTHERALVADYAARMRAAGIDLGDEDAWQAYRRFTLHGVLITVLGSMATGQDERGDRMFIAMARGHLQHVIDLFADELPS